MEIVAESIYKRFHETWIIRNFNYRFCSNTIYGIAGINGSGKTTLLHILAGLIPPSKGKVQYIDNGNQVPDENWYKSICYAAPYADLYEYMNLNELIRHHLECRRFVNGLSPKEFSKIVFLEGHENKLIKMYSSGMKQRLKLGLSILSESSVLFLDEPQSNLDEYSKQWYLNLLRNNSANRIVIIASNESEDFRIVNETIDLSSFK